MKAFPLTILTTVAICVLSLAPIGAPEVTHDVPFADKWTHMLMYAFLTLVACYEARRHCSPLTLTSHLMLLLCPIALGGLMELLQHYATTYRSGEWLDLLADALGAAIGWEVAVCVEVKEKKRKEKK